MKRRASMCAAICLLVAACGNGNESSRQSPTADGLEQAATEFTEQFISGSPGETYELLSADCQESLSRSEWAGQVLLGIGFLEGAVGVSIEDAEVEDVQTRNVTGTSGEVSLQVLFDGELLEDSGESWESWVYEDGAWRSTECEVFES